MIKLNKDNYIIYDDGRRVWSKNAGRFVGTVGTDGYWSCSIEGKKYKIHRLVWMKFRGEIPTHLEIDHINDIRDDNRLINLQLLTPSENCAKRRKYLDKSSEFIGVCLEKSTEKMMAYFRSKCFNGGKLKNLGRFNTAIEAALFRDAFLIKNGFKHHRLNFPGRILDPSILEKFKSPLKKGYVGVWFNKKSKKWKAYFRSKDFNGGKQKHLGNFNTAIEAARARDAFIIKNNLKHRLNFPQ